MNTLRITRIAASHALTCFQCLNLGLPTDGIAEGDTCIEVDNGGVISFACEDCFERLSLEIEKIEKEDGE